MKERNHVVDMLKGLGMIFVVGGHSASPFSGYYYTFHMGLFFCLTGYLMAEGNRLENFSTYLRRKIEKIIFPYFIFFIISIIVCQWRTYQYAGYFYSIEFGHIKALFTGGGILLTIQ